MSKLRCIFSQAFLTLCLAAFYCSLTGALEVFNPEKCNRGCRSDSKCPANAACIPLTVDSDCGYCVCNDGFVPVGTARCRVKVRGSKGNRASVENRQQTKRGRRSTQFFSDSNTFVPTNPETTVQTTSTTITTTSTASTTTPPSSTSTSTAATSTPSPTSTSTSKPTKGPPPIPDPINCGDFVCGSNPQPSDDKNPVKIRTQFFNIAPPGCKKQLINDKVVCSTPLLANSNECRGIHCLAVDSSKSFCICTYDKVGDSCTEDKAGSCAISSGFLPQDQNVLANTRFVHKTFPHEGGVVGRHFAVSLMECMKLCQWAGRGCKSVNYGLILESKVCELLSVEIPKNDTRLVNWLTTASRWTFACCF